MNWLWLLSYFFWGAFAANSIPHFVSGAMGRPFQTPFAKPSDEGPSSSTVNVVWGFFNAVIAYLLLARVGAFDPRSTCHILAFGLGALLITSFPRDTSASFMGATRPSAHDQSGSGHLPLSEKFQLPLVDRRCPGFQHRHMENRAQASSTGEVGRKLPGYRVRRGRSALQSRKLTVSAPRVDSKGRILNEYETTTGRNRSWHQGLAEGTCPVFER